MKKSLFIAFVLLITLAMITSSCQLPAPGKKAPTPTTGSQVQPTQPTAPKATTTLQTTTGEQPKGQPTVTLPAVTATSAPAEVTAAPTTAPTTSAPQATRIQFASGGTSSSLSGELDTGQLARYVLKASAGQTMNVDVWSPNGDVYLEVSGADGKTLLAATDKATTWSSVLATTQDYYLTAVAGDGLTSYTITVVIPATSSTSQAAATAAPTGAQFDPYKTYGIPTFVDNMDVSSTFDWSLPSGKLPNTDNIRLFLDGDKFLVTGKLTGFSTWWFSWQSLKNFYIEMTVDTRTCSGGDAYGLILRGPEHGAGTSYGYVVGFTCDGKLWVYRLDNAKPWTAVDLVSLSASASIASGSDQRNIIGVKAEGEQLTIYANGYQIAQVTDRHFLEGRYGVWVRPSVTEYYTYEVVKLAFWDLSK